MTSMSLPLSSTRYAGRWSTANVTSTQSFAGATRTTPMMRRGGTCSFRVGQGPVATDGSVGGGVEGGGEGGGDGGGGACDERFAGLGETGRALLPYLLPRCFGGGGGGGRST